MKYFSIKLDALSPLAIRSDHAPGGVATAHYISGTTLMGSLAAVHRLLYNEKTDEFKELFLKGSVHYPNLYPAVFEDENRHDLNLPVYPVPITAQSCKRHKGFRFPEDESEKKHGVRDTLLDWAMFKLIESEKGNLAALKVLQGHKECALCHAIMDHFGGYYRREAVDPYNLFSTQVDTHTRLQTYTGINRESGTVQEGILYNRQVFEEGMRFWGSAKLPDDEHLTSTFESFLKEIAHEGLVRIGTGRTRGLGKVSLDMEAMEEGGHGFTPFKERLLRFDDSLRGQARAFDLADLKPFYVALTLHSPLILQDSLLRYRGSINAETLAELTGLPASAFQLIYQAASSQRITGWNELWGMPRTNEYAIETGSVFLFACSLDPEDALLRTLFELEEQGIGQRRAEGFGRVCFSDPFHLEVKLR